MAENTLTAEFRIEPIGKGVSMRQEVERAVQELQRHGLRCEIGPMGTPIQSNSLDYILAGANAAHRAVCQESPRVVTELVIDERIDKDGGARLGDVEAATRAEAPAPSGARGSRGPVKRSA